MVNAVIGKPTALTGAGQMTLAGLKPGAQISGRVESVSPDNVLRLATTQGTLDLKASVPLPKGTNVLLKVGGEPANPKIEIIPVPKAAQPSPAHTQTSIPHQANAVSGSLPNMQVPASTGFVATLAGAPDGAEPIASRALPSQSGGAQMLAQSAAHTAYAGQGRPSAQTSVTDPSAQNTKPLPSAVPAAAKAVVPLLREQQAGIATVFPQIGALASAQTGSGPELPDALIRTMQQIMGLRLGPAGAPVSADQVLQAVRGAGLFRESGPAAGSVPSGSEGGLDLKSLLISLKTLLSALGAQAKAVRPATQTPPPSLTAGPRAQKPAADRPLNSSGSTRPHPPEQQTLTGLLRDVDAALARIRLTQLANLGLPVDEPQAAAGKPMDLVVELPIQAGAETAVLQMQIGRDRERSGAENPEDLPWRLRFALDLSTTGPMEAAISLKVQAVSASLWLERLETYLAFQDQQAALEAAFAGTGLDLQELRFIRGLPKQAGIPSGAYVDRSS
ncbi:flagellar hook-length control protein FliK [Roseibium sp. RKSG952]|uniref:flagellar hook-length control protein FliK n=1 Tax=Roseibium sp. RKSG952 TaxID=2529384 RepID=UPI0012BC2C2C|nr:flagellar hook-length control protein FliK [Roseibium sp. RKSG952]MTH95784.1 flagellar hook-length control protein FliK [Roseibium sp. RKSG952]